MITLTAFTLAGAALAFEPELPELSPRATASQQVGITTVEIDWSSPGKRDRTVWGELVPWGELWRTGANAATRLSLEHDATIGGQPVPAGTYALLTIPGETEWTVILNKNAGLAGTYGYDEGLDQVRLKVTPEQGPDRERLTFVFSDTDADSTRLDLEWAGVRVGLPIEVDTPKLVASTVEDYRKGVGGGLADAARERAQSGDLDTALALVDASIALGPTWFNTFIKADILNQQGKHRDAYKLAQEAHAMGQKTGGYFMKARVEEALSTWKKR